MSALQEEFGHPTSIVEQTQDRFWRELTALVPLATYRADPRRPLVEIIPQEARREVWRQLQKRGFRLPELRLSANVALVGILLSVGRTAALVWAFQSSIFWLSIVPFLIVARLATRPFAVHPPPACQTVRDAVLLSTKFHRSDYQAGRWTSGELAEKVRSIFANQLDLRMDEVRDDSRIVDLRDG